MSFIILGCLSYRLYHQVLDLIYIGMGIWICVCSLIGLFFEGDLLFVLGVACLSCLALKGLVTKNRITGNMINKT